MQIRETGAGTYPPVVYQPLRSPKSPFAKYGPGSSCTLPTKLGARLMNQSMLANHDRTKPSLRKLETTNDTTRIDHDQDELEEQHTDHYNDQADATLMPRFLHSPRNHRLRHSAASHDHLIDLSDNTQHPHHLPPHPLPHHHHHHHHAHHHHLLATMDEDEIDHHSVDRTIRSSSEENSNASSDHTNGGYFSEDSSQSITDLCGSSLELKVQIKQCSDEKILKKNLSQDNLLEADYISRPNEKCKFNLFNCIQHLFTKTSFHNTNYFI